MAQRLLAPLQGGEVEEAVADRALELEGAVAGQQDDGGMGVDAFGHGTQAAAFQERQHLPPGPIAGIAHPMACRLRRRRSRNGASGPMVARRSMDVRKGFVDLVGNTPLVRLNKVSDATGCEILGKCEFLNPGGCVKDRAALAIITDAEEKGLLRPGGTIVEGTAGNTGIGLALVGNARGYKTVIVIPETQSQEKMDMLRLVGADLRPVPAVPYKDPEQLREAVGPAGRGAGAQRCPTARSGPTSSTTPPTGWATTAPPARRSGRRPAARSMPSPAPSAPAARWPASACSSRSASPRCGSGWPTRWVRRSTTGTRTAS